MKSLSIISILLVLPAVLSVMEQVRDHNGNFMWKEGSYRNRNEVPTPRDLDLEKKHKRDTTDAKNEDTDDESHPNHLKKSFLKSHFSLPIGAVLPIPYSEKLRLPKGKKSDISESPLIEEASTISEHRSKRSNIEPARRPLSELLIEEGNEEHGEFKPLNIHGRTRSKIDGEHQWGIIWHDPYPNPALHRDSHGYERSTLTGTQEGGLRITEEEFDSGLMGRGLGGMKERAQNENLMQGKFAEKLSDEHDAELEDRNLRRM